MKTLIILAHPNMQNSNTNRAWIQKAKNQPYKFDIHELCEAYANWQIEIKKEQELLQKYDKIVIEFPLYWYSYPQLFKK